jgi:hypothetical protein
LSTGCYAQRLREEVDDIRATTPGVHTYQDLANALNDRDFPSPRGLIGHWTRQGLWRALQR